MISSSNSLNFSTHLLDWYYKLNCNFPWRKSNDPYTIWLSKVMLQQTQVSTVLPYYQRWISAFHCIYGGGQPLSLGYEEFRLIFPHELQNFAFHRADHKFFDVIQGAVLL